MTDKLQRKFLVPIVITQILLVLQYALGVFVTMYVNIPQGVNGWAWTGKHSPVTSAHALIGTLLLLASIVTLIFAIPTKRVWNIVLSILGVVAIVIAWKGGFSFLAGGQHDSDSFIMRIGFDCSLAVYITLGYFASKRV